MTENNNVDETLLARDAREPRSGNVTSELVRSNQQKIDELKHRVADKLASTAESFKHQTEGSALDPVGQRVSSLMATAADRLEHFETPELPNISVTAMRDQATDVIRRYPLQAIVAGLGIGLLFGRALRR